MDGSEDGSVLHEPPDPEVVEVDPTVRYIRVRGTCLECYSFTLTWLYSIKPNIDRLTKIHISLVLFYFFHMCKV